MPKTPPVGVPRDDGEWEDTGVTSVPREHDRPATDRSKDVRTPTPPPGDPKASARAAFREIRGLRDQLTKHSESDQIALAGIHDKLGAQDKVLTEIRIDAAETRTAVGLMTEEVRHKREIQKIKIEGEVTTLVEKEKTVRKMMDGRTKITLAVVAILSTGVGALVKWLVG